MAHTAISAHYPPLVDPTRATIAYGDRAVPRLNKELSDDNLIVRQRAVMALFDYLHDPEHIATALSSGIPKSLKKLLPDPDYTVRQKAVECLYAIAKHAIGRQVLSNIDVIVPLSNLFHDPEDIVRLNAHKAIAMLSEMPMGAKGIVDADLICVIVENLLNEPRQIQELMLDTLHFCMMVDTTKALETEAMASFTLLLENSHPSIRAKAARAIMDLSVPLAGKNVAVSVLAVPALIDLLEDENTDVRAKAAAAIMIISWICYSLFAPLPSQSLNSFHLCICHYTEEYRISITTLGKYTAINSGAVPLLVKLVKDSNSEVKTNALKALTCLSEAPEGRKLLLNHVDTIQVLTEDRIPSVVKAAKRAVDVITWLP